MRKVGFVVHSVLAFALTYIRIELVCFINSREAFQLLLYKYIIFY